MLGRTRFKEFADAPEGIPTNILSERLERLVASGIAEQLPILPGIKKIRLSPDPERSCLETRASCP